WARSSTAAETGCGGLAFTKSCRTRTRSSWRTSGPSAAAGRRGCCSRKAAWRRRSSPRATWTAYRPARSPTRACTCRRARAGTAPAPGVRLQTRLTGRGAGGAGPAWTLGGVLQQDQEVELGIDSRLSQPAADEAHGESAPGTAPHPALGKSSALLLELELEW